MRNMMIVWLLAVVVLGACSKDDDLTDAQKVCAVGLYPQYNPKRSEECVNVCKTCKGGNTVTCTTSCKLRGAS